MKRGISKLAREVYSFCRSCWLVRAVALKCIFLILSIFEAAIDYRNNIYYTNN